MDGEPAAPAGGGGRAVPTSAIRTISTPIAAQPAVFTANMVPPPRATTARSADGSAEPPGQLAEQIPLIFTDPRHVAVRPQQRRTPAPVR
ncbi:hypothetical protein BL254_11340 [Protofrankia sp. BMG5.30]|uniref:Uncharacterized protein n=1 Tax=Protofrankia coriariae TaxID=1562887 RepID=A0ABR5F732_9ACTN|nr:MULTISPECIES: hypothetical protein [Protofrankia]KLL12478.1 hypothetical protein FrCorBMG51_04090 [Protofrankia coriariae]ONH35529.1 hypothetical protein BL254_11340 [Protofrankia sp. BMG5.30]